MLTKTRSAQSSEASLKYHLSISVYKNTAIAKIVPVIYLIVISTSKSSRTPLSYMYNTNVNHINTNRLQVEIFI